MRDDMIEQMKDATTPAEMRAEIYRHRQYDHMVRRVIDIADYDGLSAEDRYTILAYHALKAKNEAQAQLFQPICFG
jgi:hypothetical protein